MALILISLIFLHLLLWGHLSPPDGSGVCVEISPTVRTLAASLCKYNLPTYTNKIYHHQPSHILQVFIK